MNRQVLFTSVFVFFSSLIWAQGPKSSIENDTIAYAIDLEDYYITAQYKPTHYKNAVQKIQVIQAKTLVDRGITQLDEALVSSPLIRVTHDPVLGSQLSLRGLSASHVAILIDGVPMVGRLDGGIDLSQISLSSVDRIEIVEGPLSTLYGTNAAGGVINIIMKKSPVRKIEFNTDHQIESIGVQNHTAQLAARKGKWSGLLHGRYYTYNQYPIDSLRIVDQVKINNTLAYSQSRYPWNPKQQWGAGGNIQYQWNDDNLIRIKMDVNQEHVQDYSIIRRPQYKPYSDDLFYNTNRHDMSLQYSGLLQDKYHIDFTVSSNNYERLTSSKRYYHEMMTFDSLIHSEELNQFHLYFSKFNIARSIGDNWELMAGAAYTHERGKGDRILDLNQTDTTSTFITEYAAYTDIKYNPVKNIILAFSQRIAWHSTYHFNYTPSFQFKYSINPKLAVRASYAQGYRSPSLKELHLSFIDVNHYIEGNPNLIPEKSKDIQTTISYELSKTWSFDVNLYRTAIRDQIILSDLGNAQYSYMNIDNYQVYGIHGSVLTNWLGIESRSSASLGFWSTGVESSDSPTHDNVFDINQNIAYNIPKVNIRVQVNYRHLGPQVNYRIDNGILNISKIESINLLDLTCNKSLFKNRIQLSSGIKNLLNIQQVNVIGNQEGVNHTELGTRNINPGRSYFVRLNINL